jgi:NADPH:quinone reductase-like Zn-dependent oxidoreductase/thioester reductase-like protein/ubiquinone/menaquinone biosynthesis C-methylase UbiE
MSTDSGFVHSKTYHRSEDCNKTETIVTLHDFNGDIVAVMVGAILLETTISSIMINLESQKASLPRMFEDVWRSQIGPEEKRLPPGTFTYDEIILEPTYRANIEQINRPGELETRIYKKSNLLYLHFFMKALRELGWDYSAGDYLSVEALRHNLAILPQYEKFLMCILLELEIDGYLIKDEKKAKEELRFEVIKSLPGITEIKKMIEGLECDEEISKSEEVQDVSSVGRNLTKILTGKISALPLLFPENIRQGRMGPAEAFYHTSKMNEGLTKMFGDLQPNLFNKLNLHLEKNKDKSVLRILEIGAGTGSCTKLLLDYLTMDPSNYHYTYTDVSPAFFKYGETVFKDSQFRVIYKTLNIEEDIISQGFIPHQYDLIVASYVLHATKDIRQSLMNIRRLAAPEGLIFITEIHKPLRAISILFGTLEGYSRFSDYELRPYLCELDTTKWEMALSQCGFHRTTSFLNYFDHSTMIFSHSTESFDFTSHKNMEVILSENNMNNTWLVFSRKDEDESFFTRKFQQNNRKVVSIDLAQCNDEELCDDSFIQSFIKKYLEDRVTLVEGILFLWGYQNCEDVSEYPKVIRPFLNICKVLATHSGQGGKQVKLVTVTSGIQNIPDSSTEPPFPSVLLGMSKALQNENVHVQCKCIDMDPIGLSPELEMNTIFNEICIGEAEFSVSYQGCKRNVKRFITFKPQNTRSINIPNSERYRLILPTTNAIADLRFSPAQPVPLGDHEVDVRVKAYSLNFRDVFVVLKPSKDFENIGAVGYDYAGVVTATGPKVTRRKVGDEVIGFNEHGDSLASHLRSDEEVLLTLPQGMTFAEAATLPAVVATVFVCLVKVTNLKKGDTVLIHTGSGGVGLCAIQLAKHIGCRIVATAGNPRKRAYLRSLGIEFVYNSRTTEYGKRILDEVGGVDVVLNSLTGPGFKEATLGACRPGARFVEMSKLNVWTKEEVESLRPDVRYELVDISKPSRDEMLEYIEQVQEFIVNANVKPLPYIRFEAADIRGALTYLQKARHIGKIICGMPEPELTKGSLGWKAHLFNDKSTYLITGGLGGIGMEIAKWMISKGAKYIILAGRNPPKPKTTAEITEMNSKGGNVVCMQCDVGIMENCKFLLESIKSQGLPQLRGIMHAAGVLSDASYENQTWEKYETAFHPKVRGGWNLHLLTKDYPLEHFVMFSSAAASLGSLGQSNHCAANTFLDHLAFHRHSIGLPAMTINWGQWGQVGVAANLDVIGIKPFSTIQATSALELCFRNQQLQACICEADYGLWRQTFSSSKMYLEELKDSTELRKDSKMNIDGEAFWKEYDVTPEAAERLNLVKRYLHLVIREVLRLNEKDPLDDDTAFQDMGMDSLMMIEMKNLIQTVLGERVKISVGAVKDCTTINQLGRRIVELVSGEEDEVPEEPTREELIQLIREDSILPHEIRPTDKNQEICKPTEIKTVLILGVTGNFGPFVLRETSARPHITKIYCLIRPTSKLTSKERLLNILQEKNLSDEVRLDIIECLDGNIVDENFGLSPEKYQSLTQEVDAVINLSVRGDIQSFYRKTKPSDKDSRTVNVLGTNSILKFACTDKLKHVYHASTMMTAISVGKDDILLEEWQEINTFDELPNSAYTVSKFIGEILVAQAVERGIPCKVFRFPFLGGDRKTGGSTNLLGNHLILRMMAYMYIGVMPVAPIPFPILPVDQAAEIASLLFFNDKTPCEMYNVCNPRANDEMELKDIAGEFGYEVETVDPEDFFEKVESMKETEIVSEAKRAVSRQEEWKKTRENLPEFMLAWIRSKNIFHSRKLQMWIPNYPHCFESSLDLLRKDLHYAKQSGIFAKVGLK